MGALLEALENNFTLVSLNVSKNKITTKIMDKLEIFRKKNKTLTDLHMSSNLVN